MQALDFLNRNNYNAPAALNELRLNVNNLEDKIEKIDVSRQFLFKSVTLQLRNSHALFINPKLCLNFEKPKRLAYLFIYIYNKLKIIVISLLQFWSHSCLPLVQYVALVNTSLRKKTPKRNTVFKSYLKKQSCKILKK